MAFSFNVSFGQSQPLQIERNGSGYFYKILDAFKSKKNRNYNKLQLVLDSPAVMYVFKLIAEYYSMGKYNAYSNNLLQTQDYLYEILGNPNQWQTWSDFDQTYIFSILLGNAYLYEQNGVMYFLDYNCMELTTKQRDSFKTISFSKYGDGSKKNIQKGTFYYKTGNTKQS